MKEFKKFTITILLTAVLTFTCLWAASRLFIPKWIDKDNNRIAYIIKGFYKEPKNSIDVLFTGNSDVFRGVSPMEIYAKTGITSYNFVSPGQRIWVAYAMLEEALNYQKPEAVFFNVDEVYFTSKGIGNAHKVYDNMNFGLPKLKGILDSNYLNDNRWTHLLPIFKYHDRYKELSMQDFKYAFADYTDYLKGMDLITDSKAYISETDYMEKSEEIAEIPEKNLTYLDKMRELCEKKGIEFVLFELPSPDSWNYKKHNAVKEYAEKYNLKFLDMNLYLSEIGIDWNMDTADGGDHLNVFGAEKVSAYLSEYLQKNFNLKNRKEDKEYDYWNEHYKKYIEFKKMPYQAFKIKDCRDFDHTFYEEHYELLNDIQREKIDKLILNEDKRLSLLGLILASKLLDIPISDIHYDKGKPYTSKAYLSITHKFPYVAVIIDESPIGIDLETKRDIDESTIRLLKAKDSLDCLIEWTKKESLFKSGLKRDFDLRTIIIDGKMILTICKEVK